MKRGGIYAATDLGPFLLETPATLLATRWAGGKRVKVAMARRTKGDVLFLEGLVEAGEFRAVIDKRYPMEPEAEAHRYVETLQKAGNVVLTVGTTADPPGQAALIRADCSRMRASITSSDPGRPRR